MWPLIDVLELHRQYETEKSWLRAFGGVELNRSFRDLCGRLSQQLSMNHKEIAKKVFNVNSNSLQNWKGLNKKYPDGHPIPVWVLSKTLELLNLKYTDTHRELILKIEEFQSGRVAKRVKAVIYLVPNLARLCGAHAADGCVNKLKEPLSLRWDIGDEEKSNIVAVKEWIKDLFGIEFSDFTKGKMSYIQTSMQIIPRYLIQIFDFPVGKKSHSVAEPKIFYEKDNRILSEFPEELRWQLRLEFSREVVNFDGHSTVTGNVVSAGLGSESADLRKNIVEIFNHFGVEFHNYDYERGGKILTTSLKETEKMYSLNLFRGQKREKFKKLLNH